MTTEHSPITPDELIAQGPDAMIFADREGIIRTWNAAAVRIFGHAQAHAIGQSLNLIVPDQYREAHWSGWDCALAAGETKYVGQSVPTRAERADGSPITIELGFAIVLDEEGEAVGALATARDISERWDRDRETRRRLRDLEAELAELKGESAAE